jgi:hypothetical protein
VQVVVNYDESDTDTFIELADYIEENMPGVEVLGNPDGPASAGTFTLQQEDGTLLFERSEGSGNPDFDAILKEIQEKVNVGEGKADVGCM